MEQNGQDPSSLNIEAGSDDEDIRPGQSQEEFPCTQTSTQQTPEKKEDLPLLEEQIIVNACQGQQQNKSKNIFILQSLQRKEGQIEKELATFKTKCIYRKRGELDVVFYFETESKHTLSAVVNKFKKLFTVCPFKVLCANDSKRDTLIKVFNGGLDTNTVKDALNVNKALLELAEKTNTVDPVKLLGLCLSFGQPCANCAYCKEGLHDSSLHFEFRSLAVELRSMRDCSGLCKNATACLEAQNKFKLSNMTRRDVLIKHLRNKLKHLREDLENDKISRRELVIACRMLETICSNVKRGCRLLSPDFVIKTFVDLIIDAKPKEQCIILLGSYNTGKTTLAGAFRSLFDGVTLNVNCHEQQLNFELGCALGKYLVVFEDVLGQKWPERWMGEKQDLLPGKGFHNLNLRKEHLDGSCVVLLEKKHQNKQEAIFPPSIITCNPYYIPDPLKPRVKIYSMVTSSNYSRWYKANGHLGLERLLTSSNVLIALIVKHYKAILEEGAEDHTLLDIRDVEEQILEEEYCRLFDESLSQGSQISL